MKEKKPPHVLRTLAEQARPPQEKSSQKNSDDACRTTSSNGVAPRHQNVAATLDATSNAKAPCSPRAWRRYGGATAICPNVALRALGGRSCPNRCCHERILNPRQKETCKRQRRSKDDATLAATEKCAWKKSSVKNFRGEDGAAKARSARARTQKESSASS